MCGRYYLGESEETSFWVDKTMQKEDYLNFFAGREVLESLRPVAELIMNGVEEK